MTVVEVEVGEGVDVVVGLMVGGAEVGVGVAGEDLMVGGVVEEGSGVGVVGGWSNNTILFT